MPGNCSPSGDSLPAFAQRNTMARRLLSALPILKEWSRTDGADGRFVAEGDFVIVQREVSNGKRGEEAQHFF
jgi:hypothetical protein